MTGTGHVGQHVSAVAFPVSHERWGTGDSAPGVRTKALTYIALTEEPQDV
jgi:hypothetical protein